MYKAERSNRPRDSASCETAQLLGSDIAHADLQ